ncbi:nuclear transport factor 2 family protein [Maribellus sediminis]|uniref:nuclear transport factor 2 family protein n=1 Tax=Maribellus sediminis TaxID=2696285 RepID=UPI0014302984|nr:nuclear transport factor 2 family protein [Maribellus sediminis]
MKSSSVLFLVCLAGFLLSGCNESKVAQQNESIAISFIKAWDSHKATDLNALFAKDFLYTEVASGQTYANADALTTYFTATIAGIPDSKFKIVSVMGNEKYAAIEWIWKGTNSVGWDFIGIPATGKYFELPGVSVMEIENQKIIRNSDYWDWNTFMKLIGATP